MVILQENSFVNVHFHTKVATASTVDNKLSLTMMADCSFVNHKFLHSVGSRHAIHSIVSSNYVGNKVRLFN